MKTIRVICWLAAGLLGAGASGAATVDALMDHGPDGEGHYHTVVCSDGSRGNIVAYPANSRVCVQMVGGTEVCRDGWNAEDAAVFACLSLASP